MKYKEFWLIANAYDIDEKTQKYKFLRAYDDGPRPFSAHVIGYAAYADALKMLEEMAGALEKVCKRNDIEAAVLDYYGDCAMALDKYKQWKDNI